MELAVTTEVGLVEMTRGGTEPVETEGLLAPGLVELAVGGTGPREAAGPIATGLVESAAGATEPMELTTKGTEPLGTPSSSGTPTDEVGS